MIDISNYNNINTFTDIERINETYNNMICFERFLWASQ